MPSTTTVKKRPALRATSWVLLLMSVSLLGYVGYSLLDTEIFQVYAGWKLDRELAKSSLSLPAKSQEGTKAQSPEAVRQVNFAPGDTLGRLEISRIGISAMVMEGTSGKTLRRAVGHISGTAFPGEQGNVGIAGHRDSFFRAMSGIQKDDEVTLTTSAGVYRYQVDTIRVVEPEDTDVLKGSGESILTLVTCYPFYYVGPSPKRFIVRGHLI